MPEPIVDWLCAWFANRGKAPAPAIAPAIQSFSLNLDYLEAGWLSSMEVVELVTEIEEKFAIQFSDRDLQDPRFVTIAGLAALIALCSESARQNCGKI